MMRSHRQSAEAKPTQQGAHRAFGQPHAKLPLGLTRQIDQAPPYHPVLGQPRPLPNPARHFRLLCGTQSRRPAAMHPVKKPGQTLAVVAMHPVAQDLPVHPAKRRRFTARAPTANFPSA